MYEVRVSGKKVFLHIVVYLICYNRDEISDKHARSHFFYGLLTALQREMDICVTYEWRVIPQVTQQASIRIVSQIDIPLLIKKIPSYKGVCVCVSNLVGVMLENSLISRACGSNSWVNFTRNQTQV